MFLLTLNKKINCYKILAKESTIVHFLKKSNRNYFYFPICFIFEHLCIHFALCQRYNKIRKFNLQEIYGSYLDNDIYNAM